MLSLTTDDHNRDKYQEDVMNAGNLRFRPTSPAVKRLAGRLRQERPIRMVKRSLMDEAVERAEAQNAA